MRRIVLVNMPFANLAWPNLGLSVLKAATLRKGIPCQVAYLNYDLAELIGAEDYQWIADCFAFALGGERLFAEHYFGDRLPSAETYYREVLQDADRQFGRDDYTAYRRITSFIRPFLERCLTAVAWDRCAAVGFSVTFQQTLASLCLARELKRRYPQTPILFGGAACEGEMGEQLLSHFSEIDIVFTGEADFTFPVVAAQILEDGQCVQPPPGVLVRERWQTGALNHPPADPKLDNKLDNNRHNNLDNHLDSPLRGNPEISPAIMPPPSRQGDAPPRLPALRVTSATTASLVEDLDSLPFPDCDDYFARHCSSPLSSTVQPQLFFEMSRGCWWGQKHHCGFCGLNGESIRYRSKSPQRVLQELQYLWNRYQVARASAADNILDHRYFDSLLPALAEAQLPIRFACELKTNLTRERIRRLLAAGLRAPQLGIETFLDPVLKHIDKGASALQNLQTLKWFGEARVLAEWNILYGLPGETPEDYRWLADLVRKIVHLSPPLAIGRARMDRFSPFFERPEKYQMVKKRQSRAFPFIYPLPDSALSRLAYYFDFDFANGFQPQKHVAPLLAAVEDWRQHHDSSALSMSRMPDGTLIITDTRPCASCFQRRLAGWQAVAYQFCDSGRSLKALMEHLRRHCPSPPTQAACESWLQECCEEAIMLAISGSFLALAVWVPEQSDLARMVLQDELLPQL